MEDQKRKVLDSVVKTINKKMGEGAIMSFGQGPITKDIDVIPTGSLSVDVALGIGGFPRGRVIEIYGPESSGKTTLALQVVAEAQKKGGIAVFIDAEHALDPSYARTLGVNLEDLYISQPDTGEQALTIAEEITRSGAVDIFVIDSVAALVTRSEIEGEMGAAQVGTQARLMAQALRKLIGVINRSNTCAVFINQIRHKISMGGTYGSPYTTPGGLALKFHATLRLEIKKIAQIKKGEEVLGHTVKVKVVKNKLAPPFREAKFDIRYGEGIDRWGELVDMATQLGLMKKSGTWYSYGDEKLGQGRDSARDYLKENPDEAWKIEKLIREKMGLPIEEKKK